MLLRVKRALRDTRANLRFSFGRGLARLKGARQYAGTPISRSLSRVLVCRINARMGNALFLTPLLQRVHELLPGAAIDLATSYPLAGDLLGKLPGMRRIIVFPHKGWQLLWRYLSALRRVRAERYDLVIDPAPNSTSGRLILMLCRARYRLGFASEAQWANLTHAVPAPHAITHQAREALLLCQAFAAEPDLHTARLGLALRPEELAAGRAAIARALHCAEDSESLSRVFGFFAHATALKTIQSCYWLEFWSAFRELVPEAIPIEFLPSPRAAPTDAHYASLHVPSTRGLAAAIATTRLFISADTGPMHLASATATPTVALFCASDPALYGPLKPCDLALDATQCSPREVAQRCARLWNSPARAVMLEQAS
ncbi:MAG TPA: glycosyltransferase family 9 protein [Steroidobacteraceae bacterium]|nr:glycosyltransferase family 9 protein [Steroidobacteraceae bacterium]